jgi:hypothetical protein
VTGPTQTALQIYSSDGVQLLIRRFAQLRVWNYGLFRFSRVQQRPV